MSPTRLFIEARLNDLRREIDSDLFAWLSRQKYPGVQFSDSLPLVFWGTYLDGIVSKLTDAAFIAARELAEKNQVDPIGAAQAAGEVAESAVLSIISKMAEFDQKMRGAGFPKSVAAKDTSLEIKRSVAHITKRRIAEVALLEDSTRSRSLQVMTEGPYDKFKRQQEESEKEMTRIREATWKMERDRQEKIEETAERRHRELVESMKKNNGIHINSGGDTNISDSNFAGGDMSTPSNPPAPHREKVIVKWVFGILATIIGGLIVAYMKGCFPNFLK